MEEVSKPVPFTVRVKPEPPAEVEVGEILVVVGLAWVTRKLWELDVPPPGVGFTTVTVEVPTREISPEVIVAVT